jgi:hypothetical protein
MTTAEMNELIHDGKSLKDEARLYAKGLSDISSKIPQDVLRENENFIKTYFRAQLRIAKGQNTRAKEILNGLDKKTGFLKFEEKNEPLLAAIDIAVRKTTNRKDERRNPIEPLFRLDNN